MLFKVRKTIIVVSINEIRRKPVLIYAAQKKRYVDRTRLLKGDSEKKIVSVPFFCFIMKYNQGQKVCYLSLNKCCFCSH